MTIAEPFRPEGRVAVFQPRPGIGDLIWHLPHIRAIAAASTEGRVTLITKPSTQADILLRDDPAIERIVWFDRNPRQGRGRHDGMFGYPRLVASLAACRVQGCVLLHHGASLAAAMYLAGIRHRYGYGYEGQQRRWLNRGPFLEGVAPFTEAFDQATAYTNALGLKGLREPSLDARPEARRGLAGRMARVARPAAVLGVGCHGRDRQWGVENFARLAEALMERGYPSVILAGAAHEAALIRSIRRSVRDAACVHEAAGWPLGEMVALLAEAALFVGNDSGLLNVRAALGRPAYALFGASGPLTHSARIRPIVPPRGARTGMDGISVGLVLGVLDADLRENADASD